MSDSVLLLTGIAVFSLMAIGVVLTALEYYELQKKSEDHGLADSGGHGVGTGSEGD